MSGSVPVSLREPGDFRTIDGGFPDFGTSSTLTYTPSCVCVCRGWEETRREGLKG